MRGLARGQKIFAGCHNSIHSMNLDPYRQKEQAERRVRMLVPEVASIRTNRQHCHNNHDENTDEKHARRRREK